MATPEFEDATQPAGQQPPMPVTTLPQPGMLPQPRQPMQPMGPGQQPQQPQMTAPRPGFLPPPGPPKPPGGGGGANE